MPSSYQQCFQNKEGAIQDINLDVHDSSDERYNIYCKENNYTLFYNAVRISDKVLRVKKSRRGQEPEKRELDSVNMFPTDQCKYRGDVLKYFS